MGRFDEHRVVTVTDSWQLETFDGKGKVVIVGVVNNEPKFRRKNRLHDYMTRSKLFFDKHTHTQPSSEYNVICILKIGLGIMHTFEFFC